MDGLVPRLTSDEQRRLRIALAALFPWVRSDMLGPTTVDAGNCDDCRVQPRLAVTCGPAGRRLCRDCLVAAGTSAWCDGHHDDALQVITLAESLDDDWAWATTLWWSATGEIRADTSWHDLLRQHPRLAAAIDAPSPPAAVPD